MLNNSSRPSFRHPSSQPSTFGRPAADARKRETLELIDHAMVGQTAIINHQAEQIRVMAEQIKYLADKVEQLITGRARQAYEHSTRDEVDALASTTISMESLDLYLTGKENLIFLR